MELKEEEVKTKWGKKGRVLKKKHTKQEQKKDKFRTKGVQMILVVPGSQQID